MRIQDLVKERPQVLRPKVGDVAKRSRASEASNLRPGSRAPLSGPLTAAANCLLRSCDSASLEAFGFLMLKYAFSHILETLSL